MATVELDFRPRPPFRGYLTREERWACLVAHRRAGKTVACVMDLVIRAINHKGREPRFAYIAPTYQQAKDVAWTYLKEYTASIPGMKVSESELTVTFPHNNARIRLYGAENYERLRGLYLDGAIIDEAGDQDPRAFPEVIRPALSDRRGWATFIGTPKGHNAFFDIHKLAERDDAWFSDVLPASRTKLLPDEELADARKMLTEDQYQQEYECSFEAAIVGAYYAKEMQEATEANRITAVPYEKSARVVTAWDLGVGDSTAIWFCQFIGTQRRVIDHYEASGVGLDHYVKVLADKGYLYEAHILPHDAQVRELGTGKSRLEVLASLGIQDVQIAPMIGVDDGIQAVRAFLGSCWFDAVRCERGIECLRQYRRDYDDKLKAFKARPLHDWTSHTSDAFRYLATGYRPSNALPPRRPSRSSAWAV